MEGAGAVRTVDGQVQVVGAEPVAVRVRVGEEAALQHLVRTGLDAGHQVRRTKCDLLHLGEVVERVAVQHEPAYRNQRELALRPHLREKMDIKLAKLSNTNH